MECNKDEAIRAKKLAEKKLTEKDIAGAKRFASKAQSLFPALEGLSQLQGILDVYVASQKKVNGEVDWYGIFGVDPLADHETIRKKYRKLALALHPDKNKSVGADGAFKIISEAWSLLSDKVKRDAYNKKRNIRALNQIPKGGNPQAGAGKSIHKNFTSSSPRPRNPTNRKESQQEASHQKARGGNPPVGAEKSSYNNFSSSSSSTINPATQDKTQQDIRPSYHRARCGNPPVGARKNSYDNFTSSSSSTINPATPDNVQQDMRASYQKAREGNPPVAGKSRENTFSSSTSGTRNSATPEHCQNVFAPYSANRNTFWTSCKTCMMQYEYVNIYRNQKLLCPNCRKPFLATEMPPPHKMGHKSSTKRPVKRKQPATNNNVINTSSDSKRKRMGTSGYSGFNLMSRADIPKGSSSKSTGARSESTSVVAAGPPAQSFRSTGENLKRGHEEGLTGAVIEEVLKKRSNASRKADSDSDSNFEKGEKAAKKRCINEHKSYIGGKGVTNQMALGGGGNGQGDMSGSQMGGLGREKVFISENNEPTIFRDLSQSESRNMLMEKAKMEILKKISELGMVAAMKSSRKEHEDVEKEMPDTINAAEESVASGMKKEENMNFAFEDANISGQPKDSLLSSATTNPESGATEILSMTVPVLDELKESSPSAAIVHSDRKTTEIMTMIVPDSDFVDFDKDRTEESFAENQVWAAYDDEDGMPRFYALVRGVTSRHPFKVKISWLNSRSNTDLGTLNWVGFGFSKTCGDFRISRREVDEALNSFSHRVKWTKCMRGVIQIFPRKGDVWALYRNWTSDWNELTPDNVIRKYDIVEVLEDYNEEHGVPVAPLVKVAGFKSVFHQHLDPRKIYTIPREEMFQFSHQVPSYLLTGHGSEKAPKGCRELDPAAVPEELLQIIIEPEEGEVESMSKVEENGRRAEIGEDQGTAWNGECK